MADDPTEELKTLLAKFKQIFWNISKNLSSLSILSIPYLADTTKKQLIIINGNTGRH
jgi:hypothetical protein